MTHPYENACSGPPHLTETFHKELKIIFSYCIKQHITIQCNSFQYTTHTCSAKSSLTLKDFQKTWLKCNTTELPHSLNEVAQAVPSPSISSWILRNVSHVPDSSLHCLHTSQTFSTFNYHLKISLQCLNFNYPPATSTCSLLILKSSALAYWLQSRLLIVVKKMKYMIQFPIQQSNVTLQLSTELIYTAFRVSTIYFVLEYTSHTKLPGTLSSSPMPPHITDRVQLISKKQHQLSACTISSHIHHGPIMNVHVFSLK